MLDKAKSKPGKAKANRASFSKEQQTIESRLALAERLWNWKPHPGQLAFLTLRLLDGTEPKTLVAACGRRWGKTEGLSVDIATRVLVEPDLAQLLVGPTKDQADGLFDAVTEKLSEVQADKALLKEFPHLEDYEFKRSPYCHIRRKSDSQMVLSARSAANNGRALRGKGTTRKVKRFRVVIDEAAFVGDKAINEAIRPMLATVPGGGQLVLISSPYGKRGAFYSAFLKGQRNESKTAAVRLPSSQNPIVDADFLHEMEQELTPRQFAAEFLAEFVDSGGAVFPSTDIEACTVEDDYGAQPLAGMVYVAGLDLARRGDYTVVTIGAVEGDRLRLVHIARLTGLGWRQQIDQVCDVLQQWGVRRVCPDRTGIGDMPVETLQGEIVARRMRCEVVEFVFTETGKRHIVDGLAICLSKKRLAFPPHPILLSELSNFEVVSTTVSGRERMEARSGHDDTVMSLGLMVEAATPYWARVGGVVGGSSGKRIIGAVGSAKDADFGAGSELLCDYLSLRESENLLQASGRLPLRERLLLRLAVIVSRFAVGRVALGYLHRKFNRRTSAF